MRKLQISPRDVAVATAIAVCCILVVCAHKWRLREGEATGYWRAVKNDEDTGGEYQITPDGGVSGRTGAKAPITSAHATIRFPRRVCIKGGVGVPERCGSLDMSGRYLSWGGGERWVREGVFDCKSCIN